MFSVSDHYDCADHFRQTERTLSFFARIFVTALCASVSLYVAQPLIRWTWAWANGTMDANTFRAPFRDMYGFVDERHWPVREVCYVLNIGVMLISMGPYLAVDLMFMGTCFYLVSLYAHLRSRLLMVDGSRAAHSRTRAIVDCVRLHNDILRIIVDFNALFGSIVFVQFAYSLFTLCTVTLTAVYVRQKKSYGCFLQLITYCNSCVRWLFTFHAF